MLSLEKRINILETDLMSAPIRISAYHDLPFTIFQYNPKQEYEIRRQVKLMATRIDNAGRKAVIVSLAELLWEGIERTRGLDYVITTEEQFGYNMAQTTVSNLLSSPKFLPLPQLLLERISGLDERKNVVLLIRAGAAAPVIYRMSKLLDEMHGKTMVPMVLFYPGEREGESELRFMSIPGRVGISGYNYRVKIY